MAPPQQQVVNPFFFKGSAATVRFEVARVKRTPSGDLFVSFALPPSGGILSPSPRPSYRPVPSETPGLDTSQPTFARFPITPFPSRSTASEDPSARLLHGLRREKGFPVVGNSLFGGPARLPLNRRNEFRVTSLFDSPPEFGRGETPHACSSRTVAVKGKKFIDCLVLSANYSDESRDARKIQYHLALDNTSVI